mmetsp:Transcript_521/g.1257  ORF Transcript_521/g.1257 Transcript_521/m.1257 type:complete len:87 (-) Transcript_521:36-296(-)
MEQLLQHVRFPFISFKQIITLLSQREPALVRKSPAFMRAWTEAFEVQAGKRKARELGERAQKRRKGGCDQICEFDSAWCVETLLSF